MTVPLALPLILLIPFAAAGLAMVNAGLGRVKSAAHSMLASLCVMSVAVIAFVICGFALAGTPDHGAVVMFGGKPWGVAGGGTLFLARMPLDGSPASLSVCFQLFAVAIAVLIPLGTGSDRWRLGPACASSALFAAITYPLLSHWVWGGGWLAQLGTNCGLGHGLLDGGGASTIHVAGGLTALAMAWVLGPRRGKYNYEGMPTAIPGHNAVYVLFACLLCLAGWFGLNGAGAMLFYAIEPGRLVQVFVNTFLSAGSAVLASALITRTRFGRPDASLCANGWLGGLVASGAGAAWMPPALAIFTGLAAGALAALSVEWLELYLSVDDPAGAISVHGVCGIWGLLAGGVFASLPGSWQWLAQLVGIATLLGFVLPLTYGLNLLVDRITPQRVAPEGERQGMDLHELGGGAYPEFVTHTDDYLR